MVVIAIIPVFRPGKIAGVVIDVAKALAPKTENLVDAEYLVGARNRQQPQRQPVQHGKDADVDAHAESDGKHRGNGEARAASQRSHTEAHILPELLKPGQHPHFVRLFFHARHIAELPQRRIMSLFRRHSAIDVVLCLVLDMFSNIVIELLKHFFAARHRSSCLAGLSTCAMAAASFSHLLVSTESCFLPFAVSA